MWTPGVRVAGLLNDKVAVVDIDIPRAAVFLASDYSGYVTGHTLMVDGGSCKF